MTEMTENKYMGRDGENEEEGESLGFFDIMEVNGRLVAFLRKGCTRKACSRCDNMLC